jgi:hypothetical protein
MLCTKCFSNEGLRIEAERLVSCDPTFCPTCKSPSSCTISSDLAHELIDRFFCHGSQSLVVAGHIPVYKLTASRALMSGKFDPTLEDDYQMLIEHYNIGVRHNAPAEWRMGMTDHYHALSGSYEDALQILDEIISVASNRILPSNTKLYRVRTNVRDGVAMPISYDAPPNFTTRTPGRYDDNDLPLLYASFDIETCIHECRCTVLDEIVIATLRTTRDLRIVDFESLDEPAPLTPFQCIGHFLHGLSVATEDEYPKCRMLSRRLFERGFDGFTYRSFFSKVKGNALTNIALFGHPIREAKVSMTSVNRIKIDRIDYGFSLGPVMQSDEG